MDHIEDSTYHDLILGVRETKNIKHDLILGVRENKNIKHDLILGVRENKMSAKAPAHGNDQLNKTSEVTVCSACSSRVRQTLAYLQYVAVCEIYVANCDAILNKLHPDIYIHTLHT